MHWGGTGVAWPAPWRVHVPRHLWRSPLLIFPLVHGPHGALDVLHTHEALVQAEVVPHGVLGVQGQGLRGSRLGPAPLRRAHAFPRPGTSRGGARPEDTRPQGIEGPSPAPGSRGLPVSSLLTAHFFVCPPSSPCQILENSVYQLNDMELATLCFPVVINQTRRCYWGC